MTPRLFAIVFAGVFACSGSASAAPLSPAELPPALRDWLPWVQHGQPPADCPAPHDGGSERACVWPSQLELRPQANGARFRLDVQVWGQPARVSLPGEAAAWPQEVKVGGKALAVTAQDDRPGVWLTPGVQVVEGFIPWRAMPQDLAVPAGIAAIVIVEGASARVRSADAQGRLWLKAGTESAEAADEFSLQTVRRLDDDVPMFVTTRFALNVSGRNRSLSLPLALLPGMLATEIKSALPARLQPDGSLLVQARSGPWVLEVTGRQMAPLTALKLPAGGLSPQEVWVVAAHNELRQLRLDGPPAVDTKQVEMPDDWRSLPAFRLQPGETLKLVELQRGSGAATPEKLSLQRTLWLDFDGGGLTVRDRIEGELQGSARLQMAGPIQLGSVTLDDQAQPITRLSADGTNGPAGVALRERRLRLEAQGRIDASASPELPASGWQANFESVSAVLNLPPGWRLLHAGGADSNNSAWLARWTLWDFFFVLLSALAAAKLLGWRVGALVGAALVLGWHMDGTPPRFLWLAALAFIGIGRALPEGKAKRVLGRLGQASALLIGLWLLPFAVDQVRLSIYPALELPSAEAVNPSGAEPRHDVGQNPRVAAMAEAASPAPYALKAKRERAAVLDEIDPGTRTSTGPGLPGWQWQQHHIGWSGPVTPEQSLRLLLLPPAGTVALRLGSLALMAAALAALLGWRPRWPSRGAPLLAAVLVATLGLAPAEPAQAARPAPAADAIAPPPDELIAQMRARLNPPPECLPRCAEIARLSLSAAGARLQLRLELHTQAAVAVPLPGQGQGWQPGVLTLDGKPLTVRRDDKGALWAAVPAGVHQLGLEADVGTASTVDIALPAELPVRQFSSQLSGWTLAGLDARGAPGGALSLSRAEGQQATQDGGTARDALAPLVLVERELQLGLRWVVQTRISRLTPSRAPLRVRVPLLPGETLNDSSVSLAEGAAWISLGAEDGAAFTSTLKPLPRLQLQASSEPNQIERWQLDAIPQWHIEPQGLAAVALSREGRWAPAWQPWPGETLALAISRPAAVPGQTLTIDGVDEQLSLGARASSRTLQLRLRTSLGGNHALRLPAGASLQSLQLDGQPLAPSLRDGSLLVPLSPGAHTLQLAWREPEGAGLLVRSSAVDLGAPGVNQRLSVTPPPDRIVLALGGPRLGPAVLFWGVLVVVLALAWRLPRHLDAPLNARSWALLGAGVAPVSLEGLVIVLLWFVALSLRQRLAGRLSRGGWMGAQLLIGLLSLVAMAVLFATLHAGLLGAPDLMIAGNGSTAAQLHWFADRFERETATAWLVSVPLWSYRLAMLLWALWLAQALLRWLPWAWGCFAAGGLWPARGVKSEEAQASE